MLSTLQAEVKHLARNCRCGIKGRGMTDQSNQESTLPSTKDTPFGARNDASFQRKKEDNLVGRPESNFALRRETNFAVRKEQSRNQRYGRREETPRRQRHEETERGSWTIELNTSGSPVSGKRGDARDKDRKEGIGEDNSRPVHKDRKEGIGEDNS